MKNPGKHKIRIPTAKGSLRFKSKKDYKRENQIELYICLMCELNNARPGYSTCEKCKSRYGSQ